MNVFSIQYLISIYRKKESESNYRHKMDQLSLLKKDYDTLKRQLKKKREIADGVKQILPTLEMNLKVTINFYYYKNILPKINIAGSRNA